VVDVGDDRQVAYLVCGCHMGTVADRGSAWAGDPAGKSKRAGLEPFPRAEDGDETGPAVRRARPGWQD